MPGAGLGQAIVARIAQANDATADVRTSQDGSTFTLAFPPHPPAATSPGYGG
jgi:light-regulated signal transduction histidine kinase (bacteriophytochrome)